MAEARKLFAQKGFRGATVREITGAAHANIGAVTYHFGSKQALYDAVLEAMGTDLARRTELAAATTGSAVTRLRAIVHAQFTFFQEAPDVPRLLVREIAAAGTPPPALVPLIRRNLAVVDGVVREGRARGELRPIEPMMVAFSMISQSVWFALVGRFLPAAGAIPPDDGTLASRVEAHIAELIRRAVLPEAETP